MDKLTHAQAARALDELEESLPRMIRECDGAHLMDAFSGEAEIIELRLDHDDRVFFRNRLQCMLRDAGLIPGDDEPCIGDSDDPQGQVPSE